MGVWGGWAGVWHRNGPGWGGRWRRLVLRARVWNCDGEGSKTGQGRRRGGGLVNFIPCKLLVGVVNLLKQRLEPESDVGAREPDGAAGDGDKFSRQVLYLQILSLSQICNVNMYVLANQ